MTRPEGTKHSSSFAKSLGNFRDNFELEAIKVGTADTAIEKLVLRHLENHAGLILCPKVTNLFRKKMAYWRVLFSEVHTVPDGKTDKEWQPCAVLHRLNADEPLRSVDVALISEEGALPATATAQTPPRASFDLSAYLMS